MPEYYQRNSRRSNRYDEGQTARRENQMYGHQGEAIYTGFSNRPLDVQSRRDDRILARFEDNTETLSPVEKLTEAVEYSWDYLPAQVAEEIEAIFTPATLATMIGVFGVYVAAHATGIGQAFDIGMLIAGGIFFGLDAFTIFKDIAGFANAINATTEEELEEAGKHLASAIAKIGVDAVMTLLTKKVADEIGKSIDNVNQVDEVHAHSDGANAGNLDNADNVNAGRVNNVGNANKTPSADTEMMTTAADNVYPEGIHLDTNLENHIINIDGFTQQKGVKGAHNLDIFNQAVSQYKLKIVRKDKHPTIEGIYEIEYQVPKKNKLQEYTGDYRTPKKPLVKTVYDPDIISNDKILEWGQQAAAQGYENAMSRQLSGYNETVNGLEFRIYLDLDTDIGKIKNVHPK